MEQEQHPKTGARQRLSHVDTCRVKDIPLEPVQPENEQLLDGASE